MRVKRIKIPKGISAIENGKPINLSLLDPILDKYKSKKGSLIPILQQTQDLFNYVPKEAFEKIANETNYNLSDIYGVATFYAQFRLAPVGKHIVKICHGTACHVQNADAITVALEETLKIKDGETTEDRLFTLEAVACLGCCSLAPVMMIGDETYGKLTNKKTIGIIRDIRKKEKEL